MIFGPESIFFMTLIGVGFGDLNSIRISISCICLTSEKHNKTIFYCLSWEKHLKIIISWNHEIIESKLRLRFFMFD